MFNYYFNIAFIYFVIGFGSALVHTYILKRPVVGGFLGALVIGIIGAFIGGVLDYFLADILAMLRNINNSVNIFPPIVTALTLLWILSRVADRK